MRYTSYRRRTRETGAAIEQPWEINQIQTKTKHNYDVAMEHLCPKCGKIGQDMPMYGSTRRPKFISAWISRETLVHLSYRDRALIWPRFLVDAYTFKLNTFIMLMLM